MKRPTSKKRWHFGSLSLVGLSLSWSVICPGRSRTVHAVLTCKPHQSRYFVGSRATRIEGNPCPASVKHAGEKCSRAPLKCPRLLGMRKTHARHPSRRVLNSLKSLFGSCPPSNLQVAAETPLRNCSLLQGYSQKRQLPTGSANPAEYTSFANELLPGSKNKRCSPRCNGCPQGWQLSL